MDLKIEVNGCARPGANTPARALGDHKLCHIGRAITFRLNA